MAVACTHPRHLHPRHLHTRDLHPRCPSITATSIAITFASPSAPQPPSPLLSLPTPYPPPCMSPLHPPPPLAPPSPPLLTSLQCRPHHRCQQLHQSLAYSIQSDSPLSSTMVAEPSPPLCGECACPTVSLTQSSLRRPCRAPSAPSPTISLLHSIR